MMFFHPDPPETPRAEPLPAQVPQLENVEVAAKYRGARVGGDFFDFVQVNDTRLVLLLMDVAGKRHEALAIAASVQQEFRTGCMELLADPAANTAEAATELVLRLNRALMAAAGGVRCAPAFLAIYDSEYGMLHYCNAGHMPGLLKDSSGITLLDPTGLALGLFSHTTNDAQVSVLKPGDMLMLVSKGAMEARAGSREFGLDHAVELLFSGKFSDPESACEAMLQGVDDYVKQVEHFGPRIYVPGLSHRRTENDRTVLAIMRLAAARAAHN